MKTKIWTSNSMKENGKISMGWTTKSDEKTYNRSRWISNQTSFDSRPQHPRSSRNTRIQDRITSLQEIQIIGRRQGTVNIAAIIIGNKQEDWDKPRKYLQVLTKAGTRFTGVFARRVKLIGFLTGNCAFRRYLHKFGIIDDATCKFCGLKKKIRHVMMNCDGASFEGAGSWNLQQISFGSQLR